MMEGNLSPRKINEKSYILVTFVKSKDKEHKLLDREDITCKGKRMNLISNYYTDTGI